MKLTKNAEIPCCALSEHMNEGALTLSDGGAILYANRRFAELVNAPLQSVIGAPLDRFVALVDRQRVKALLDESADARSTGEVTAVTSDGKSVQLRVAFSRSSDPSSRLCIATEITTEHERTETLRRAPRELPLRAGRKTATLATATDALRANEELIRATLYSIGDAVISTDASNRVTHLNSMAETLIGCCESEAVGRPLDDVFRPFDAETEARVDSPVAHELRYGRTANLGKAALVTRDGLMRSITQSTAPIRLPNGTIAGVVLVVRDETAERMAQAEMQSLLDRAKASQRALLRTVDTQRRLCGERERLMTAIEQAGEAVCVTTPDGTIEYVNPAFEAVTGYSAAEAVGQNPRILKSEKHDEAFYRELWGTIRGGRPWRGRMVNRRKNGTTYTEAATISPVCDPAGKIVAFVAVKRDISETVRLAEELAVSQRMDAIGRLAGGVAHDFNNLLAVIMSCTEFALAEMTGRGDPLSDDLVEVRMAAGRAAALTRQLLAFSRKQVVAPQVLDLNKIVTDLHKMLRRILREDIEPTLVLAPDLGRIRADPGQIEQVIMNLVVNARDAMESGGKLTIETENVPVGAGDASPYEGLPLGPRVMLAVSDTGCGIDEGARGQLFEPFFTTKERGKGTGLGLSTVYGIVKQCGGMISVQSEAQKGSTFRLYFPRALEQSTPPTPSVTPAAPATPPHETILVVEDEEALRKVAVRILQAEGYRVLSAANGAAALAIAERCCREIDLLLTDVVMPHMGGRQLAERLQTAIPTLRVLFMSGYSDNALSRDGVLESGTRLISKPFSRVDLAQSVRSALDEADGERCAANACFLR